MTREEKQKAIGVLKISVPFRAVTREELTDYNKTLHTILDWLEQEPCDDCISRQAVLNLINADWKYEGLESDVENLPPVTPQPKTGHWVDCGERESWYRCSECGRRVWGGANQYCPDCGLKMIKPYESEVKK